MRRVILAFCVVVTTAFGCASDGDEGEVRGSSVEEMQAACERAATRQKLSLRGAMTNRRHVGTGLWVGEYAAIAEGEPLARRGSERRLLCEYSESAKTAVLR